MQADTYSISNATQAALAALQQNQIDANQAIIIASHGSRDIANASTYTQAGADTTQPAATPGSLPAVEATVQAADVEHLLAPWHAGSAATHTPVHREPHPEPCHERYDAACWLCSQMPHLPPPPRHPSHCLCSFLLLHNSKVCTSWCLLPAARIA